MSFDLCRSFGRSSPKIINGGNNVLSEAWNMRISLEAEARGYKHATMLPEETIVVEGKKYACYVVHVTSDDSRTVPHRDSRWDRTFWIDKSAHVFRKQIEHLDNYIMITKTVHVPFHQDTSTVYPVADFDPRTPVGDLSLCSTSQREGGCEPRTGLESSCSFGYPRRW